MDLPDFMDEKTIVTGNRRLRIVFFIFTVITAVVLLRNSPIKRTGWSTGSIRSMLDVNCT